MSSTVIRSLNGLFLLPTAVSASACTSALQSIADWKSVASLCGFFRQVSFADLILQIRRPSTGCGTVVAAYVPEDLFPNGLAGLTLADLCQLEGMDCCFIDASNTAGAQVSLRPTLPSGCVSDLKGVPVLDFKVKLLVGYGAITATTGSVGFIWKASFEGSGLGYLYSGDVPSASAAA